jgi:hypothetical protein
MNVEPAFSYVREASLYDFLKAADPPLLTSVKADLGY